MEKIAFLFPGQGAQYAGMGKDFYETYQVCKEVMDLASEVTGLDIPRLCFTENEQLHITEYTQVAMLSVEAAIVNLLEEHGIVSKVNAGLSLGEYGALVASKVVSLEDAFSVVRKRGIFMEQAVPTGGAMSAVLGLDGASIEAICNETEGIVSVANYNCPGQIVITGQTEAVLEASKRLKEAGAKRIVPLKVSGPFHSSMLVEAGKQLKGVLDGVQIQPFCIPYISNVTADYVTNQEEVKELLVKQVSSSVRWQQSIEKLICDGVTTFVEIGPGRTLSGFMRKINSSVTVYNIQSVTDFKEVCNAIK